MKEREVNEIMTMASKSKAGGGDKNHIENISQEMKSESESKQLKH